MFLISKLAHFICSLENNCVNFYWSQKFFVYHSNSVARSKILQRTKKFDIADNLFVVYKIWIQQQKKYFIEVVQGGVSCWARHNWLWIFSLFWAKNKIFFLFFFQYCQPAQNQPKSHILFYKDSPCQTSIYRGSFGSGKNSH